MKRLLYIFVSFFFLTLGGCSLLETYGLMDGNNSKGDSDLEEQLDSLKTRVLVLEAIMNAYESNRQLSSVTVRTERMVPMVRMAKVVILMSRKYRWEICL